MNSIRIVDVERVKGKAQRTIVLVDNGRHDVEFTFSWINSKAVEISRCVLASCLNKGDLWINKELYRRTIRQVYGIFYSSRRRRK